MKVQCHAPRVALVIKSRSRVVGVDELVCTLIGSVSTIGNEVDEACRRYVKGRGSVSTGFIYRQAATSDFTSRPLSAFTGQQ